MKYNQLSFSDLKVSQICLGTMTFGNPVIKNEAKEILHWVIDQGINFIDTADIYEGYDRHAGSSGGVAEKIIGDTLKGIRNNIVITTKVGNSIGGKYEGEGLGKKHIEHQINRSLRYLKTDYIDLYQMHRSDPNTPLEESISVFMDLIKLGKIRYWGVSNFNAEEMNNLIAICLKNNWQLPIVSQSHYSWLNRELENDLLPLLQSAKINMTPFRILEGGLLSGKYNKGAVPDEESRMRKFPNWITDLDEATLQAIQRFEEESAQFGLSPLQYAAKWLLQKEGIPSVLVGAKSTKQIEPFLSI